MLGWGARDKLPACNEGDLLLPAACSTCPGFVAQSPTDLNLRLPDPPQTQSPIPWLPRGPGLLFPGFLMYPAPPTPSYGSAPSSLVNLKPHLSGPQSSPWA